MQFSLKGDSDSNEHGTTMSCGPSASSSVHTPNVLGSARGDGGGVTGSSGSTMVGYRLHVVSSSLDQPDEVDDWMWVEFKTGLNWFELV